MIKKALSIFLAFSCFFSAGAPVFADGDDEYLPIQYRKKHQLPPKRSEHVTLSRRRKTVQKAFLVGLLLATGANIEIAFRKKQKKPIAHFIVQKINDINIQVSKSAAYQDHEIAALLNALKCENFKFEFSNTSRNQATIISVKINDFFLSQSTMYKIGEKILNLITEKKSDVSSYDPINLNDDIKLRNDICNIFSVFLEYNPNKNTLNFFELPSDSKKIEPVINPAHVNYLKRHPDAASRAVICYQKMFFTGLLSAIGIKVTAKEKIAEIFDDVFPQCIEIHNVDHYHVNCTGEYYKFLENIIKRINYIFPPEKLKVEALPLSYLTPTKVTINNQIVLNETDIFNLGQRFYNLVDIMLFNYSAKLSACYGLISLNESINFTKGVNKIFKDYTGQDLPDVK